MIEAHIYYEHEEEIKTQTVVDAIVARLFTSLGKYKFGDIRVAPFAVERFNQQFGLIFDPGEINDDEESYSCVTVQPRNYIEFNPLWYSDYDT